MADNTPTILQPLIDKLNVINRSVELLECLKSNEGESLKILKLINIKKSIMMDNVEKLKCMLEEQVDLFKATQVEQIKITNSLSKLDKLEQFITIKQLNESDDSTTSQNCKQDFINGNSETGCSYEEFSPVELNRGPPVSRNLKPKYISFDISPLTDEEFKLIPKYMAGRIQCAEINKFIDVVNEALSKKYDLLSKPLSSLKMHEQILRKTFKNLQNTQPKGQHFVTEEDIARELGKTILEKKAHNFLTILRHTKRVTRNTSNRIVIYTVDNSKF